MAHFGSATDGSGAKHEYGATPHPTFEHRSQLRITAGKFVKSARDVSPVMKQVVGVAIGVAIGLAVGLAKKRRAQ